MLWSCRVRVVLASVVAALVLTGVFLAGVVVGKRQSFPFRFIYSAYLEFRQIDAVFRLRHWMRGDKAPERDGRWIERAGPGEGPAAVSEVERDELEVLGYLPGVQEKGAVDGVTIWNQDASENGTNLYCSGHGPEAFLIGMDGSVRHRWKMPYDEAFPRILAPRNDPETDYWRRVHLYPNGDLLAIFEGVALIKIDRDSRLIWARRNRSHHDLCVLDDGRIFVLTRKTRLVPEVNPEHTVLEDFITVLGPDGVELERYSVLEAVMDSQFAGLMDLSEGTGDLFHTNTLEILDGSQHGLFPAFAKGNALVSLAKLNTVAVIDLEVNQVIWALTGLFEFQHDPELTVGGRLLVFDNLSRSPYSRVIELDPRTQRIVWAHGGSADAPFFTDFCGSSQRLPNGNTLITVTAEGRALEVTTEGEVVWEYLNPHTAGELDELVAIIPEMVRLVDERDWGWLERP